MVLISLETLGFFLLHGFKIIKIGPRTKKLEHFKIYTRWIHGRHVSKFSKIFKKKSKKFQKNIENFSKKIFFQKLDIFTILERFRNDFVVKNSLPLQICTRCPIYVERLSESELSSDLPESASVKR